MGKLSFRTESGKMGKFIVFQLRVGKEIIATFVTRYITTTKVYCVLFVGSQIITNVNPIQSKERLTFERFVSCSIDISQRSIFEDRFSTSIFSTIISFPKISIWLIINHLDEFFNYNFNK